MNPELTEHLEDPEALEEMFRRDPSAFEHALRALPTGPAASLGARFWFARLGIPVSAEPVAETSRLLPFLLLLCAAAGTVLLKLTESPQDSWALRKNAALVFFSALCALCLFKNREAWPRWTATALLFGSCALYVNHLSGAGPRGEDTLTLACVFLPLFLWSVFGLCHAGFSAAPERRIDFLRFNGDLLVLAVVLQLAGMLLCGITMALFGLIGVKPDTYMRVIASYGAASIPPAAWYLLETRRVDMSRVSRVVARIFSPMALVMLVVYFAALGITRKNPYLDRSFLITFNFVLVCVMALIFFSVAGEGKPGKGAPVLFGLCLVALVLNAVALSAIAFRLAEFGGTPNRVAALGSNLLIFIHLARIAKTLWTARKSGGFGSVERTVTGYLPVYAAWSALVVFAFPLVFRFL